MDRVPKTAPDGDTTGTGSSDPYLGDLARQSRRVDTQGACPGEHSRGDWESEEYRDGCYDPYVAGLAGSGRGSV